MADAPQPAASSAPDLADLVEAEAAFLTGSVALAVVAGVAGCAWGPDAAVARELPLARSRRVALYPAGRDYGPLAPVASLLRVAGCEPMVLGDAQNLENDELNSALKRDPAVFFLPEPVDVGDKLHPCTMRFLHLTNQAKAPSVVAATTVHELPAALDAGATLSVAPLLDEGPAFGVVAGDRAVVHAARVQARHLGKLAPIDADLEARAMRRLRAALGR